MLTGESKIHQGMLIYKTPRKAIYNSHEGKYHPVKGWLQVEREVLVIGETADNYVYEFQESSCPHWDELGRYTTHYCFAVGFHKSRLVKWVTTQLQLNF